MLTFWKGPRQKGRAEYLVLIPILILAAVLCCYRIAEPGWEELPQGYILGEYLIVARNYLKFGYLATKLGQVIDYGWTKPGGNFTYRIDHPPLLPLLISVSFRLFGIHEWSVRLIPVLSSLLIPLFTFILARKWLEKKMALLASLFLVLSPMYAYYSRLPAQHILASSFSLLTFVFYYGWTETGKRSHCLGMYISLVLGALSDWVAYSVVPAILLHYVICEYRKSKSLGFVFPFALTPVMLFGIHLGWACLLKGQGTFKELLGLFLYRTVSEGSRGARSGFTPWDFYISWYTRSKLFLTPTVWFLSIVGGTILVTELFQKKFSRRSASILALFLFGLVNDLVFSNRVFVHDYGMLFHLIPFFAIAAALGAQYVAERVLRNKWQWIAPFVLAICYSFGIQSISTLEHLHSAIAVPDFYLLGSKINEITDPKAKIVTSFPMELRMASYADRPWSVTSNLSELRQLQAVSSYNYYVMDDTWPVDKDLREYLIRNHPMEIFGKYRLFNLWETGSNVIVQGPRTKHPANINFGDKLMFLGYNIEEAVQRKTEPSRLEKYLNARAELLPEHRAIFRITYFWQCLEEMEKDYTLVTQFEGHYGKAYRIEQSHQGVNGVYPTSFWRVGEVIKEEYEVEIPADYPPIRYALWVGVRDGEEGLEVVSDAEADEEDRVRLREIEVLPAERLMPLVSEPQPQNRIEADINDKLLFVGYDLNKSELAAGEELKITTYWQSLRQMERDYAITAEIRGGEYKVRQLVDLPPTRLWQEGEYYRADTIMPVNPCALEGTYLLKLRSDSGQSTTEIELATLDVHSRRQRRHILKRVGKANYGGGEIISPEEPFSLRFNLKEKEALELLAGWTGRAGGKETRVEVYISNAYWRDRYLGTWVVESGGYRVTRRKVGRRFTAPGENVIKLRVPEVPERVHNVGWRGVVDRVLPDLLQDSRTDYDGPIQLDLAQVSTRWKGDWDDYYDLAKVYADREMRSEIAGLYEEATDKGVEPGRVDHLALFKGVYRALGEEGKVKEIESRIASRIPHKMSVNLGGKAEFLGYGLTKLDNGCTQMHLFFQCVEEMEEDYTLWVHGEVENESLLEGQKREAGYAVFDHLLPTSRWQVGEVYQDDEVRELKPGRYLFTLGLWRPEDGSRLWREDNPEEHIIDLGWVEVQ